MLLDPWVASIGKPIFMMVLGTETPLSSKLTVMKEQQKSFYGWGI